MGSGGQAVCAWGTAPGPHEGPGEAVMRGEQTDCEREDEWASVDAGTLRSDTLVRSEG